MNSLGKPSCLLSPHCSGYNQESVLNMRATMRVGCVVPRAGSLNVKGKELKAVENVLNRREFTRVPVNLEAEVTPESYLPFSTQVTNASLKGLYLRCDSLLPIGSPCGVELFLGNIQAPIRIAAKSKVVRVDRIGMGLEITSLVGPESFDRLRNLMLYNATDTDTGKILQEFQNHAGLKR